ncbi:uncharacterized protein LOC134836951 [Culicoides brevitarsis]|uniref:uncharacterized protein LOC134836951 n=1 Tax=Culicoides brevitarsis TaxID=469753 RepID=UPI00307B274F
METQFLLKVMFQGSLLNDLPTELKYQILDFLDASSLKKCRLLNKTYLNLIDNCEKYNKHWILDVSDRPLTAEQDFVQLYTNSSLKFGRLIGNTNKFSFVPKLFQKLGETVTCIKNLPFSEMDRKTTEMMIKTFDKVEYLKTSEILLRNMNRWGLIWPSVKRLTIFCGSIPQYKGNYSEFPNVEDVTIEFFGMLMLEAACAMIKACPEKVTGIKDKMLKYLHGDFGPAFEKIENLKPKRLKLRYNEENNENIFLPTLGEVTWYDIRANLSRKMEHYAFGKVLPEHFELQFIRDLSLDLMRKSLIPLNAIEKMPNLIKFRITLSKELLYYTNAEQPTCFLEHHETILKPKVIKLVLDTRGLPFTCLKCIRTLICSFPKVKSLHLSEMKFISDNNVHHFWKMLNGVLKKTGIFQHLTTFHVDFDENEAEIDSYEYNIFKKMTPLPNAKHVHISTYLENISQNNLKTLCDKIPAVKRLYLGTGRDMDFNLAGFLISQLKYLKYLKFNTYTNDYEYEELGENVASRDLIDTLLKVPLKLWDLDVKINSETKDTFPLFEKFPTLRKMEIQKEENSTDDEDVYRTEYYDHIKKKPKKKKSKLGFKIYKKF